MGQYPTPPKGEPGWYTDPGGARRWWTGDAWGAIQAEFPDMGVCGMDNDPDGGPRILVGKDTWQELVHARNVLDLFWKADLHSELFWRVDDGHLRFFAMCNDVFWWATADLEEITPGDMPLLNLLWDELRGVDGQVWLPEYYAARKRGMRPQGAWYKHVPDELVPLFDACGPPRPADKEMFGNPVGQP